MPSESLRKRTVTRSPANTADILQAEAVAPVKWLPISISRPDTPDETLVGELTRNGQAVSDNIYT